MFSLGLPSISFSVQQWIRCFVAEAVATCLLIVLASAGSQNRPMGDNPWRLGLSMMVVSLIAVRSNGGFQNPCMSIAIWASGYEPTWSRTLVLVGAEFTGGLLAALIFLIPNMAPLWSGPVGHSYDYLYLSAFATLMLVLVLLSVLSLNVSHGDPMYLYLLLPILLGGSAFVCASFLARTVGFEAFSPLNPAFSLAIALSSSRWNDHWVEWFGPFSGSLLAAILHRFVFQPRKITPTTSL